MTVTIRRVDRYDRPQWQILWDEYNAFYGRSGATALAPAITELTWARFFDPVMDAARLAGSSRIYWQTKTDNHTARALYDRVAEHSGFIVYGRELNPTSAPLDPSSKVP